MRSMPAARNSWSPDFSSGADDHGWLGHGVMLPQREPAPSQDEMAAAGPQWDRHTTSVAHGPASFVGPTASRAAVSHRNPTSPGSGSGSGSGDAPHKNPTDDT